MSLLALVSAAALVGQAATPLPTTEAPFGMIGKIVAKPGQRRALMALLAEGSGTTPMAGNLSYVIGSDSVDDDAIWVSETWVNKPAHDASLSLPQVRGAIAKARPLIAAFGESHVIVPVLPPRP